jgi:hypothetical protein
MFLIRAAFWLSVVILFLPADPESNSPAPRVDLSNFCERNPDVCVTGNAAFQVFAEKAQNGAKMLYRYLDQEPGTPATDGDQGTLTGEDIVPEWQGPAA